jgi:site-specific recombinase XerD
VGLDQTTIEALERWIKVRRELRLSRGHPVFSSLKGASLDASYVRRLFPRLARRAGIEKRVHAHGLRHTLAAELADEGVPMHVIRGILGHTSLATTQKYVDHLRPTEVIDAMQSRRWGRQRRRRKGNSRAGTSAGP